MNKTLDLVFDKLKLRKIDAYYLPLSNENLYEFTKFRYNYLYELTGFRGDTGSVFVYDKKAYLFVDGRFTIQAKNEVNDKRIKIIEVERSTDIIDNIIKILDKSKSIIINPKLLSIAKIKNAIDEFCPYNIKLVFDDKFLKREFNFLKKDCFNLTSAPLFVLDKKYAGELPKAKIIYLLNEIYKHTGDNKNVTYITSNLEEIAYITNLRYSFCDLSDESVLFDAFMVISNKKTILYINDYLDEKSERFLNKNGIYIDKKEKFYYDIKKISDKKNIYLDERINNYYIHRVIKNIKPIESPLSIKKSIKNSIEIKNLKKCNIIDGIAMIKILYSIKSRFKNTKNNIFKTEYDIKRFVDDTRRFVGKNKFLCPSFETIVAYKENSAICHYTPNKYNTKKLSNNGLLLIDSGGHYLNGTTDITRTISLYKTSIPLVIKKHYTLVLKSLINLSLLKFPSGLTGFEIDIIARKSLYDNFLDFNHGTGHGIGYVTNVHDGPNRIGPYINKNYKNNELLENQVTSNEPGLYFEGKYGIRIENDILTKKIKSNDYGDFLGFETLTLCPFDRDLIEKKYLSQSEIKFLNSYHKLVYDKLNRYLDNNEKKWLMKETREV